MKITRRHAAITIGAFAFGGSMSLLSLADAQDHPGAGAPGGPFSLTDHTGRAVTDRDYRGKFMLVFFGYTMCPDVCPATLLDITAIMSSLGDIAERVQPLFISVDPERDSAGVLKDYLSSFDPRIVGLTGTPEQIRSAAKAYKVFYAKFMTGNGNYTMDHSAFIYLMDPEGGYLTHFVHGATAASMANDIRNFVSRKKLSTRK